MDSPAGILLGILLIIAGLVYGFWRNGDAYSLPSRSRRPKRKNPDNSNRRNFAPVSPPPAQDDSIFDQVDEITRIFNRFVIEDLRGHTIREIIEAGYGYESQVWKIPIHKTDHAKDASQQYLVFMCQVNLFYEISHRNKTPQQYIDACFSLLHDIAGVIDKCKKNGIYSRERAIVQMGLLLSDFARTTFPNKAYKNAYWKNSSFVNFYTNRWNAYDELLQTVKRGQNHE